MVSFSISEFYDEDEESESQLEDTADRQRERVPETDEEDGLESRSRQSDGEQRPFEKPDIHESIKELKVLLHTVCAKVEKNEESLRTLQTQQEKR